MKTDYTYALAGGAAALVLLLLIFTLGFIQTLLLFAGVGLGALIGLQFKDSGILENLWQQLKQKLQS